MADGLPKKAQLDSLFDKMMMATVQDPLSLMNKLYIIVR